MSGRDYAVVASAKAQFADLHTYIPAGFRTCYAGRPATWLTKASTRTQVPITMSGVAVEPGDIVLGDDDGVVRAHHHPPRSLPGVELPTFRAGRSG